MLSFSRQTHLCPQVNPEIIKKKQQNILTMFWGNIFRSGQKVAVLWCKSPATVSTPGGAGISTRPRISPWSEREERRADERRGLTLPFKSLSPAPLTARIDLALPWIHPGHQQERMHKAHYLEHAYSHTWSHTHTDTHTRTQTVKRWIREDLCIVFLLHTHKGCYLEDHFTSRQCMNSTNLIWVRNYVKMTK